jgi:CRISPR-associated protein Csm1
MSENTDKNNIREQLYLAALLHDIGKFYQRADKGVSSSQQYETSKYLSPNTINNVSLLCPSDENKNSRPQYVHVLWTYEFLRYRLENLPVTNKEDFAQLSALHHKPDPKYSKYFNTENINTENINTNTENNNTENIRGLAPFIQLADSMASGMDRTQRPAGEQEEYGMKTQPLYPITAHILLQNLLRKKLKEAKKSEEIVDIYNSFKTFLFDYGYLLNKLSVKDESVKDESVKDKTIFPKDIRTLQQNLPEKYYELWSDFEGEVNNIPSSNIKAFSNTLFYLLKKYLWCVPASASQSDMPDISLFEHLKVTAAFTICLFDFYNENSENKNLFSWNSSDRFPLKIKDDKAMPFLLFCGDLSGIQDYIYNIYSKEARKSLKGRSFYLELLTKTIVIHILDKLNLFPANEIYSSGGKFYLLLPNIDEVKSKLNDIEKEIQKQLLNEKSGNLYVCMDYIEFGYFYSDSTKDFLIVSNEKDFEGRDIKDLGTLWRTLTDKTARKKFSKYSQVLNDDNFFNQLFTPQPDNYPLNVEVCAVTGEIADKNDMQRINDNGNDVYVLKDVYKQTQLGEKLKSATHIAIWKSYEKDVLEYHIEPLSLGWKILILNENDQKDSSTLSKLFSFSDCYIFTINDTNQFLRTNYNSHQCSHGFWFYGGNSGNEKTFEELCKDTNETSFTRLGVLRMDVDGLGNIFKHGLEYVVTEDKGKKPVVLDANNQNHLPDINRKKSFSAYATLSQQLNYFFCGYLNTIRERDEFNDYVQIVYSGGDDLFVVGKWDKIISFAEEVKNNFSNYTLSKNFIEKLSTKDKETFSDYSDFGISGGIELITVKYPIQRGAIKSGEAEEKAKNFNNNQKNAICLLNVPVSWDTEWDYVKEWRDKLSKSLSNGNMKEWKNKLSEPLSNGNFSKGLLQKIFNYYEIIRNNELIVLGKKQGKPDLSWQWNMSYIFARNMNDQNKEILNDIQKEFICGALYKNKRILPNRARTLIALAARLAELDYRTKQLKTESI